MLCYYMYLYAILTNEQHLALAQVTDYRRGADIYWLCNNTQKQQALCVLLPMTTPREAKQFVERVLALLSKQHTVGDNDIKLTGPLRVSAQQTEITALLNELGAYDEDLADATSHNA